MSPFTWRSGERTIVFGEGSLEDAPAILGGQGFTPFALLTSERAIADAPALAAAADKVHHVAPGSVPEAGAELLGSINGSSPASLVAFGGGRVVDAAKGVAAVTGARVAAIPTTLAGSSTTGIHRLPAGHESEARGHVRPLLVIGDPEAMTSAPEEQLRATAMNALGHGAESLYGPRANPVSEMIALRGASLIASSLDTDPGVRDRAALAEGALLCGSAIDSTGLALHHAICQSLVRVMKLPHADTNAAMLPHTMAAMTHRAPRELSELAGALGTTAGAIGARIADLSGGIRHLAAIGARESDLEEVLDVIESRADAIAATPDPPTREEIRRIVEEAW